MNRIFILLLAGTLLLSACSGKAPAQSSEESPPPLRSSTPTVESEPEPALETAPEPEADNRWQFDAPENHNMDPAVFERLHAALADSTVYAMVTAKDGVIIDEYYQEGYDENSVFALHSCSKSFTSALIGIAIEQGTIGGVDDLLSDYLPQVAEFQDGKQNLTLRHLLTHTSGLEWYEWGGGYSNWEEFRSAPNWVEYILGRNLVSQPGAAFNYSTGNTHLLATVLEAATGKNALDYGKEVLFDPLGIESIEWGADPQGVTDGGNGVRITARDAARFGQLYLQDGEWHGEQLVPAGWAADSTAAKNSGAGDGTGSYGYHWWTRSFGDYDTYYAFGAWGQYIFVVPELDLVTVIANAGPSNSYAPRPYFTDYVLAAVQEEA
ncbi:serine hydrolase domain-containing protein [Harryflintia acetispora]|uniref:serine hydrolase domain-containing protein n=1 Tax=Harryflintia acetispora TaxID=1849041 RepID=UPI0018995414|nr:serine hydrolase [Harryflintia acetispora]